MNKKILLTLICMILLFSTIALGVDSLETADAGSITGTYDDSDGTYADTQSTTDNTYYVFGSGSNNYDITAYAELVFDISGLGLNNYSAVTSLNFSIDYCHSGERTAGTAAGSGCDGDDVVEGTQQGDQNVEIYNYTATAWLDIGNLRIDDVELEITDRYNASGVMSDFIDSGTDQVRIRFELDYNNDANNKDSFLLIDYLDLNVTYDGTAPTTALVNVAGDTTSPYYDTADDSMTNITVNGEALMWCRWDTSDVVYSSMSSSNECYISGTKANCTPNLAEGYPDVYVSCKDVYSNEQSNIENIDVIVLTVDWTNATTTDNSTAVVLKPTAAIQIQEADNVDTDPTTYYCTDTSGSCTPTTSIDNQSLVLFTTNNRGQNYLRYYSIDDAGNVQIVQNTSIEINQLPSFTGAQDNATTIKGGEGVKITTTSSDSDSHNMTLYVCDSDSATSSGCSDNTYCTNATGDSDLFCEFSSETDSASHNWYAFIYDVLTEASGGNSITGSYTTDVTLPTLTNQTPDNTTHSTNSTNATVTSDEALSWAGYSMNGTANVTLTNTSLTYWTGPLSNLPDGVHNITFYGNDSVGNMDNSTTVWFTITSAGVDSDAPVIIIYSPDNNTYHSTSDINMTIGTNENCSSANYTLANGTQEVLTNQTTYTLWNRTAYFEEGSYVLTYYANDTSDNWGSTSGTEIYFYVDLTAPQNTSQGTNPVSINNTENFDCYTYWSDSLGMDYGYMEHNETGTAYNSSYQAMSGTSGWTNTTISYTNVTPGQNIMCKAYAYNKAGTVNTTTFYVNASDTIYPQIGNITYQPNTTFELDPNIQINVSLDVYENHEIDSVILQYRNDSTWTNTTMGNSTTRRYNKSFTPTVNDTWYFRVISTDSYGNENITDTYSVVVETDLTWENTTTIPNIKTIVTTEDRNISLGTITINNTGDSDVTFGIGGNVSWIIFNNTNNSVSYDIDENFNTSTVNVTAETTGFAVGKYYYSITANASDSYVPSENIMINGTIIIQNVAGPYLYVVITSYEVSVDESTATELTGYVQNLGTQDASDVYLNWTLPSSWSLSSGQLDKPIGTLAIGQTAYSTITADTGTSSGTKSVSLNATCDEGSADNNTISIVVGTETTETVVVDTTTISPGGGGYTTGGISMGSGGGFSTGDVVELVRGETLEYTVTVKNVYIDSILKDVYLDFSGYMDQYLTAEPNSFSLIEYGDSKTFTVKITVPDYMERVDEQLRIDKRGDIIKGNSIIDLFVSEYLTLEIHEISKSDSNDLLDEAQNYLNKMLENEFYVGTFEEDIIMAKEIILLRDYEGVRDISNEIISTSRTAFEAHDLLNEISGFILFSEENGVQVSGTKDVYQLALSAFDRGDYETALERLQEAQNLYALEGKGKISIVKAMVDYWWITIIGFVSLSFGSLVSFRRFRVFLIGRKLKTLDIEEYSQLNSLKKLQETVYVKKKMGIGRYKKEVTKYRNRIAEIMQERSRLMQVRKGIIRLSKHITILQDEYNEINKLMKKVQTQYYVRKTIGSQTYKAQKDHYRKRKIEIEEDIALTEAKLAEKVFLTDMIERVRKVLRKILVRK